MTRTFALAARRLTTFAPGDETEANEIAAKTNALLKKSKADKVDKAIIEVLEISAAAADEVGAGAWHRVQAQTPRNPFQPTPSLTHLYVGNTPTQVVSAFQDPHAEELKLEKKHADEKKSKDALAAVALPTAAQLALAKQAKVRRAQAFPHLHCS